MVTRKSSSKASKKATPKKPSKKAPSRKGSNGKAAVAKGRKFEDEVAELYRLLGAQVVQNIEIHQKKVDIFATFRVPGSSREHRVIVECKDEKRAVDANQRVMAFKGLLDTARAAGTADSAEIVTRVSWSDQAKGFARTSGVDIFTYSEKIAQLIDFTTYLKEAISRFEVVDPLRPSEPPLGAYYVDLSAEVGAKNNPKDIPIIDTFIHEWLQKKDTERHLAIFGEFGSGKSSLCQKLSHDLAASYLNDPTANRIPILLNLREFIGKLDIEAYITSFLDRECKATNPRIDLFRTMNNAGMFLLLFDGFDEMAVKVDADTLESNLMEIEKLAAAPNSKVILTSRPEYFISTREEMEALTPEVNPFLNRATNYEPLKILPWEEPKVEAFLKRRVPLIKGAIHDWTYYRDKIQDTGSLSDLSQRPVLLEMIVRTLPRLIASGEAVNLPSLYRNYIIGEMKRQKVLKKRTLVLSDEDRLTVLQRIAVDIFTYATPSIAYTDALKHIENHIRPPKHELESLTRDLLTNSFLIRRSDEYFFSHKSILEYLVATKLNEEIISNAPELFGRTLISREIQRFIVELNPDKKTLFEWIKNTKKKHNDGGPLLGGNAATLLCNISPNYLVGKNLSGTNLTNASLYGQDLRDTNLHNTILSRAILMRAKFFKKDFTSAEIAGCEVSLFLLKTKEIDPPSKSIFQTIANNIASSSDESDKSGFTGMFGASTFRDDLFYELTFKVSDIAVLESYREILSSAFDTKVAFYFDELEELAVEADLNKARTK